MTVTEERQKAARIVETYPSFYVDVVMNDGRVFKYSGVNQKWYEQVEAGFVKFTQEDDKRLFAYLEKRITRLLEDNPDGWQSRLLLNTPGEEKKIAMKKLRNIKSAKFAEGLEYAINFMRDKPILRGAPTLVLVSQMLEDYKVRKRVFDEEQTKRKKKNGKGATCITC